LAPRRGEDQHDGDDRQRAERDARTEQQNVTDRLPSRAIVAWRASPGITQRG
jgi:hypothetical protein